MRFEGLRELGKAAFCQFGRRVTRLIETVRMPVPVVFVVGGHRARLFPELRGRDRLGAGAVALGDMIPARSNRTMPHDGQQMATQGYVAAGLDVGGREGHRTHLHDATLGGHAEHGRLHFVFRRDALDRLHDGVGEAGEFAGRDALRAVRGQEGGAISAELRVQNPLG